MTVTDHKFIAQECHDIGCHFLVLSEVRIALSKLTNEVSGLLGIAEPEIRSAVGNTNVTVLKLRIAEADAVLEKMEAMICPTYSKNSPA